MRPLSYWTADDLKTVSPRSDWTKVQGRLRHLSDRGGIVGLRAVPDLVDTFCSAVPPSDRRKTCGIMFARSGSKLTIPISSITVQQVKELSRLVVSARYTQFHQSY